MHNDTPLGTTMYLKDLDRRVIATRDAPRGGGRDPGAATAVGRALISLLRRLDGARLPVRVASRG